MNAGCESCGGDEVTGGNGGWCPFCWFKTCWTANTASEATTSLETWISIVEPAYKINVLSYEIH